jgi:hypothetical protein
MYRLVLAHLISNLVTLGVGGGLLAVIVAALCRRYRPDLAALRSTAFVLAGRTDRQESPAPWPAPGEAPCGQDSAASFDLGPS